MKFYKFNRYNEIIPVREDNCFLIFNVKEQSLDVIDEFEGLLLSELSSISKFSDKSIGNETLVKEFTEKKYILESGISEIEEAEKEYLNKKDGTSIFITVTTTTICNMDCPYCFETNKPSIYLKTKLIENIKKYVFSLINGSANTYTNMDVVWYGGEPLINIKAISELTPFLIELCAENDLIYSSQIITNGIYLTSENVRILSEECFVNEVQVTIDGPEHVHNKHRPLKAQNQENYTKILRNLAALPESVHITLRINVDKEVADNIDELLEDLYKYKIWPHRIKNMNIDLRQIVLYEGAKVDENDERYLDHRDFFDFRKEFRKKKLIIYNNFQLLQGGKPGKLSWDLPSTKEDCGTWGEEAGLVIDPKGNIHKCWETVHLFNEAVVKANDLENGFSKEPFKHYLNYNRYKVKTACRMCKYISVCDKITCQKESLDNAKPPCTIWKFKTKEFVKEQYLDYINNTGFIGEPDQQFK